MTWTRMWCLAAVLNAAAVFLPLALAGYEEGIRAAEAGYYETAFRELKPAAEAGVPKAQNVLGVMYARGLGVGKDEKKAVEWFRRAAEQGYLGAINNLGLMYQDGEGVSKNETEAARLFRQAAELGSPDAQHNLGLAYSRGIGVIKDESAAIQWYRKAAEADAAPGVAAAENALGLAYQDGHGVPQDYTEAAQWFRKAAERGAWYAQLNLAQLYQHGLGVPQGYLEAYVWAGVSLRVLESPKGEALRLMKQVSLHMTPEQKSEAEVLENELWKRIQAYKKRTSDIETIVGNRN